MLFQNEIIANNPFLWFSLKPSRLRSFNPFVFISINSFFACSIIIMTSRYLSARLRLPRFPTSTAFLILITSIFVSVNIFFLHRFDLYKISRDIDDNWIKIMASIDPTIMPLIRKYQKRQIILCNFFMMAMIFLWLIFVVRGLIQMMIRIRSLELFGPSVSWSSAALSSPQPRSCTCCIEMRKSFLS